MWSFFENTLKIRSYSHRSRSLNISVNLPFNSLPLEEQRNFTPDKKGGIGSNFFFDASFEFARNPEIPFIAIKAHQHLTLKKVKEFLKRLRITRFALDDSYSINESVIGVLLFHRIKEEAKSLADKSGVLLIYVPENADKMYENLKPEE